MGNSHEEGSTRPIAPFAVIYFGSFVATGVGNAVWRPATVLGSVLYFAGALGAAIVAFRLLRAGRVLATVPLWWALVGALGVVVLGIWNILLGPYGNPIGLGLPLMACIVLFGMGAFQTRI